MFNQSKRLGTLRFLVSVYVNVLINTDPSMEVCHMVFQPWFLSQLFPRLIQAQIRGKGPSSRLDKYPVIKGHLEAYVDMQNRKIPEDMIVDLRRFLRRPRDALALEMLTKMKQTVSSSFVQRAEAHIRCALEQSLWEWRESEDFVSDLRSASKSMLQACTAVEESDADFLLAKFSESHERQDWLLALQVCLGEYRAMFSPLRQQPVREIDGSVLEYNLKRKHPEVLHILSMFRKRDAPILEEKQKLAKEMDEKQPKIKASKVNGRYLKTELEAQRNLFKLVPVPEWLTEEGDITDRQVTDLLRSVSRARTRLWEDGKKAGFLTVPKSFTLLPVYSLQPAFVQYDNLSIRYLIQRLGSHPGNTLLTEMLPSESRIWWTSIFDFHRGPDPSQRYSVRGEKVSRKKRRRRRKLLRRRRLLQKGIPLLVKNWWVVHDDEYEQKKKNPEVQVPWLVNSIITDGLQVKVTVAGIIPVRDGACSEPAHAQGTSAHQNRLPDGVGELVHKGYWEIRKTFVPGKHSWGIFSTTGEVPPDTRLHIIGVDPGQVKIAANVRRQVDFSDPPEVNAKAMRAVEVHEESRYFLSKQYRFESLSRRNEKWEQNRRVGAYKEALQEMSQVSLKTPGKGFEFARVVYYRLADMHAELMSPERRAWRLARFRAQQRSINHVASSIAFGSELDALRRTKRRGKSKQKLKRRLYGEERVVFFGSAQFGHGSRGPCPRKKLVRSLSLLCPVVLVNEHRTSKCCHGCGAVLEQIQGSRVFRCPNSQTGEARCPVRRVDRDVNGAANIGTCGIRMLLGMDRPSFLNKRRT